MDSCPWSGFERDPFPFCEEQLCHIIGQPANSWSNIGYFLAAYFIMRNSKLNCDKKYFAFTSVLLGISSTLFHMSGTLWAKKLDVGSMLLISALTLTFSLRKKHSLNLKHTLIAYAFIFGCSFPLVGVWKWGGYLFIIQCLLTIFIEIFEFKNGITKEKKKSIIIVCYVLPVALLLNMLDQNGTLCSPGNHIFTIHGLWHLMTAYCLYLVAKYYLLTSEDTAGTQNLS